MHIFFKKYNLNSNLAIKTSISPSREITASILRPLERSSSRLNSLCSSCPTISLCLPPSIRSTCTLTAVISVLPCFITLKLAL